MTSLSKVHIPLVRWENFKRCDRSASNLPLQMALYFNVFYFPLWLIVGIAMLEAKYNYLEPLYCIVLVAVLIAVSTVEVTRLYLGYLGNLTEMIPELAGFWLLTLLLQFPLLAFLLFSSDTLMVPMERVSNLVMMVFILSELISGYFAIKSISNQLATKFLLQTLELQPAEEASSR